MLEYARWKYILIAVVLAVAVLFALPNFFAEAPALQLAHADHSPVTAEELRAVTTVLQQDKVPYTNAYVQNGRLLVLFANVPDQLRRSVAVAGLSRTTDISPRTAPGESMRATDTPSRSTVTVPDSSTRIRPGSAPSAMSPVPGSTDSTGRSAASSSRSVTRPLSTGRVLSDVSTDPPSRPADTSIRPPGGEGGVR